MAIGEAAAAMRGQRHRARIACRAYPQFWSVKSGRDVSWCQGMVRVRPIPGHAGFASRRRYPSRSDAYGVLARICARQAAARKTEQGGIRRGPNRGWGRSPVPFPGIARAMPAAGGEGALTPVRMRPIPGRASFASRRSYKIRSDTYGSWRGSAPGKRRLGSGNRAGSGRVRIAAWAEMPFRSRHCASRVLWASGRSRPG